MVKVNNCSKSDWEGYKDLDSPVWLGFNWGDKICKYLEDRGTIEFFRNLWTHWLKGELKDLCYKAMETHTKKKDNHDKNKWKKS